MASATQTQQIETHELSSPGQWETRAAASETREQERPSEEVSPGGLSTATLLKVISAAFSFFVAGVNDGSLGAIIPYVIREYNVSTAIVSSVYGATFAGWLLAAVTNTHLCQYLNLGSMLVLGALLQVLTHVLRSWLPPFGLYVTTFFLVALGQAYNDTQANTYVASVRGAHRWLAVIHASYMAGCLTGPFIATAVASAGSMPTWYLFYIFPLGVGLLNVALICWAFRDSLSVHRKSQSQDAEQSNEQSVETEGEGEASRNKNAWQLIKTTLSRQSVWLLGMFYFFYIGSQLTANGWVVEYLVEVRGGDLSSMGYVPAGFNGGCLVGRLLLAEPTYRLGERRMVFIYCCLAVGLQLIFWLVPNIIAASVAISFIGFFTGPLFATGISLGSKLFPHEIHATALVFVFVFAQMGGSVFPIMTGVIASRIGVGSLQPILIGIMGAMTISWLIVPRPKSLENSSLHQE